LLVTDRQPVLDLRHKLDYPVLWLAPANDPKASQSPAASSLVLDQTSNHGSLLCHPRYPDDMAFARGLLSQLDRAFDLAEPFARIREAIGEARKMGVHK
jgi:hypothetical protein